jgi:hypothetical protein
MFFSHAWLYAQDMTSSSFIIDDPQVGTGGGFSSSTNFGAFLSGDMTMLGTGTSTNFEGRYGFLYYPYAIGGVLSGSLVGGTDIQLDWGATDAGLGWNVGSYEIGKSTVSGSGYSYTNVSNVLTYTYPNHPYGTYYFIIRTLDTFGNVIEVSNEVSVTVLQSISFAISDEQIGFGSLTSGSARYATGDTLGSGASVSAHTLSFNTNAGEGYSVSYRGGTLASGANTIAPATITADVDGAPGTAQFALALTTTGDATIPTGYRFSSLNWNFIPDTTTTIVSETNASTTETIDLYYLGNTSANTPAGAYTTTMTYIITPNF